MRKPAKVLMAEIFTKIKEIPEQAKINQQLRLEETQLIEAYRKTYGNKGLYRGILERLSLVAKEGYVIPLIEATVACPEAFCFDYKREKAKPLVFFEVTTGDTGITFEETSGEGIDFCTLTLTPKGTINLLVAETDGYFQTLDFQDPQGISLLLNLPYLFGEVVKNENFSKIKQKLLAFVKVNPTCTLANIYNYAKAEPAALAALPENVTALERAEDIFSGTRRNFGFEGEEIKAFFSIKINSFQDKDLVAKYLIEREENGEVSVRLDTSVKQALPYLVSYPVKLLVKADGLVPMFLPDSFFQKEEPTSKATKEAFELLTKEGKLAAIMQPYQLRQDEATDFKGTEKYFREELNYNTKKVIKQLEKALTSKDISGLNEKEQKNLETLKTSQATVAENVNKISKVLAEVYKKEIVLNNL